MATKLNVGDRVYVPWSRLGAVGDKPAALHHATVLSVEERSVVVSMPNDSNGNPDSRKIASSAVLKNVRIAIVRIGDQASEHGLIEPLGKSVLQCCRLLHPDDFTVSFFTRSLDDLRHFWDKHGNGNGFSHIVLIGHGSPTGITFGTSHEDAAHIAGVVASNPTHPKVVISLCCSTGRAQFGKAFSSSPGCRALIAPFNSIHGANASQLCQTFFAASFLTGMTTKVAFKHTERSLTKGNTLKLWVKGHQAS
jgi:pimeloyl-ACP methyl ester carboxylesterase